MKIIEDHKTKIILVNVNDDCIFVVSSHKWNKKSLKLLLMWFCSDHTRVF